MRWMWIVLVLLGFSGVALAEDKEFHGSVTDDMCGSQHMMEGMSDKQCADECVGMGASYALFVPADEKMYLVDDPEKLKPFAGENVVVTGELDEEGKTLRITSIAKAKEE